MNCARNCGNLLNFVKVIPKTLLIPFFSRHGVYDCSMKSTEKKDTETEEQIHILHISSYKTVNIYQSSYSSM